MRHEPLLSMQEELREFVMQTQIKLTAVRKLIGDTAEHDEFEVNPVATSDRCAVLPEVATTSPRDASELFPTSTATQRLEAIKRRLSEQIEKN